MGRSKYLSLKKARREYQLKRFVKECPSEGDEAVAFDYA